jgi:hypothetical protein
MKFFEFTKYPFHPYYTTLELRVCWPTWKYISKRLLDMIYFRLSAEGRIMRKVAGNSYSQTESMKEEVQYRNSAIKKFLAEEADKWTRQQNTKE